MAKLIPFRLHDGTLYGYGFWCPACQNVHAFNVAVFQPLWSFDGNMESPTFGPSLRMIGGNNCHLFVQQGMISYCPDSGHALAGKIVPMVDFDIERWCPVDTLHTLNGKPVDATATQAVVTPVGNPTVTATAAAATMETHLARCGDVGNVGPVCPHCGVVLDK